MIFGHNHSPGGLLGPHGRVVAGPPFKDFVLMYGCEVSDGQIIDKNGKTEFPSVIPSQAVGDGSMYFELYQDDGTLGINLGTKYDITIKSNFSQENNVYLTNASNPAAYIATYGGEARLSHSVGGGNDVNFINAIDVSGNEKVRLVRNDLDVTLYVDDMLIGTEQLSTNTDFIIDRIGGYPSPFELKKNISLFKITDTNEVIMNFSSWSQVTDNTSAAQSRIQDDTGNYYAQAVLALSDYIQQDIEAENGFNEHGYTVARALGKNLVNADNLTRIGSADYSNVGNVLTINPINNDNYVTYRMKVDNNTNYTLSCLAEQINVTTVRNLIIEVLDLSGTIINSFLGVVDTQTAIDIDFSTPEYFVDLKIYVGTGLPATDFYIQFTDLQVEQGTTPTTYEAWEGYYKDSALTVPWQDGQLIPAKLNANDTRSKTECIGYVSDGQGGSEFGALDFVGSIKRNVLVIDGVVDNGYEYGNWNDAGKATVSSDGIELVANGASDIDARYFKLDALEPSTEYLVIANILENTQDATFFVLRAFGVFTANFTLTTEIGEQRFVMTTLSSITQKMQGFLQSSATSGTSVKYTLSFYKVSDLPDPLNPLTSDLPESGQPVIGNSLLWTDEQRTIYAEAAKTDTTDVWHDDHTLAVPSAEVVPISSLSSDNNQQYFFSFNPDGSIDCALLYNRQMTEDEIVKIGNFLGFLEPLAVAEGNLQVAEGDILILKEGVGKQ